MYDAAAASREVLVPKRKIMGIVSLALMMLGAAASLPGADPVPATPVNFYGWVKLGDYAGAQYDLYLIGFGHPLRFSVPVDPASSFVLMQWRTVRIAVE
jgi:hypothetical protein